MRLLVLLFLFLFLTNDAAYAQSSGTKTVQPLLETSPCHTSGDNCDDSAIWIHPSDPAQSIIIGDDKGGGIVVWDLAGSEMQYLDGSKRMNNLDLRYNFPLSGTFSTGQTHTSVALVVADNESDGTLNFYKVNPSIRKLESAGTYKLASSAPYGGCMYHSPVSNKYYFFVNWKSGVWHQIELAANGGTITGTKVREADAGGQTEGCTADDINSYYYIGEEAVGVWRYGAEPGDGSTRVQVNKSGDLTADTEGMSIYYRSDGGGYLIVSSQGNSTFMVYERNPSSSTAANSPVGKFVVGASGNIDASSGTDGLDVTNFPLGTAFPKGLLVNHDSSNTGGSASNHKYVPFERIATALNLTMDTTWDPRKVGGSGNPPPVSTSTPTPPNPSQPSNPPSPTSPSGCAKKTQGDASCDGKIDGIDYSIWLNSQCHKSTSSQICSDSRADYNGDGNIDDQDLAIWIANSI